MMFGGDFDEEWEEDDPRESRFIWIGRDLDKEYLQTEFIKCVA